MCDATIEGIQNEYKAQISGSFDAVDNIDYISKYPYEIEQSEIEINQLQDHAMLGNVHSIVKQLLEKTPKKKKANKRNKN